MRAHQVVSGLLLLGSMVWAQAVSGRVVDSVSGQALAAAELRLNPRTPGVPVTTTSDAEGLFRFESVPLGRYTLSVKKDGYPPMSYGASGLGNPGQTLVVPTDRGIGDLEVRLIPFSSIQGKVVDRD